MSQNDQTQNDTDKYVPPQFRTHDRDRGSDRDGGHVKEQRHDDRRGVGRDDKRDRDRRPDDVPARSSSAVFDRSPHTGDVRRSKTPSGGYDTRSREHRDDYRGHYDNRSGGFRYRGYQGYSGYSRLSGRTNGRWDHFVDTRHNREERTVQRETWFNKHSTELDELERTQHADAIYSNIPLEISGNDPPKKLLDRFTDIDLGDILEDNILRAKFIHPMPVQKAAIPMVLSNRDVMACAQTGSGKTAAFLFPIISRLLFDAAVPTDRPAHPRALVLAPTRELATQIFDEAIKFARNSPVRPVVIYGGAEQHPQLFELDNGCDVLVATPGRLIDFLERGRVKLSHVQCLVLDEADRMLDMGFEPQIRRIVDEEGLPVVGKRQTLMFSATFPREIQLLAQDFLDDYLFLSVGRVGSTTSNITQSFIYIEEEKKKEAIVDLICQHPGQTLIFVDTKRNADMLEYFLINEDFSVVSIHGDRTQRERENALFDFKSSAASVLVATDVAARGLDIPAVVHVINYDLPNDIDNYVHRIGRTGRAGKTGLATSFINETNRPIFRNLLLLLKEANQDLPEWLTRMLSSRTNTYNDRSGPPRRRGAARGRDGFRDFRRDRDNYSGGGGGGNSNNRSTDRNYSFPTSDGGAW